LLKLDFFAIFFIVKTISGGYSMCNGVEGKEIQRICSERGIIVTRSLLEKMTRFHDVFCGKSNLFSFQEIVEKVFEIPEQVLEKIAGNNPVEKFFELLDTDPQKAESFIFK